MVCDKLVCQRWWVTERCVKYSMLCDKVVRVCVKDGVSKMVGAKVVCVCVKDAVSKMVGDKVGCVKGGV